MHVGSLRTARALVFAVALSTLVAIAYLSNRDWQDFTSSRVEGRAANQATQAEERLLSALLDAQAEQRGYLLTGRAEYLEPFNSAVASVDGQLARLRGVLAGQPSQLDRAARLGDLIAEKIADALQQGYTNKSQPYHGYYFKILKGQGPAAPLGAMDFVVNGAMIGGFALAAAPAEYRVTGVQTFIVSYEGVVYQKDLGPNTLTIFKNMTLYNPDKTWQRTNDNW